MTAELFAVFFKIGLFTFGGGYAMIPLIQQECLSRGWMDAETFYSFIGVCESTPGPVAVNMATFVGSSRGGFVGALCATLGVVLPALLVMLLVVRVLRSLSRSRPVRAMMRGIRPVVGGMILAAGLYAAVQCLFPQAGQGSWVPDPRQAATGVLLFAAARFRSKVWGRPFSPILLILLAAGCGVVLYGI